MTVRQMIRILNRISKVDPKHAIFEMREAIERVMLLNFMPHLSRKALEDILDSVGIVKNSQHTEV